MEIDGRPICIDIPNGEYWSVAQTNQLFIEDVDSSGTLDIISYAIDGEVEVFYGWENTYISTDPNECDDWAIGRNNRLLLKSLKLTAWSVFSDNSLIHRPWLDMPPDNQDPIALEWYEYLSQEKEVSDPGKLTRQQAKQFTKALRSEVIEETKLNMDQLIDQWKQKAIDYLLASPEYLRPFANKSNQNYAWMRAQDTHKSANAQAKVTKSLTDQNGGYVEKWDLLTVTVSISGWWSIDYLEKLDLPVLIFKDEFGKIQNFSNGIWWEIDRNISNGYEFMISGASAGSFSYEVMYNGNWHARVEVESLLDGVYDAQWVRTTWFGTPVYAQWWHRNINIIPDDSCYKWYRQYSPWESVIELDSYYEEKRDIYNEFFAWQAKQTEEDITDPDLGMIKKLMWLHEVDFDPNVWAGIEWLVNNLW